MRQFTLGLLAALAAAGVAGAADIRITEWMYSSGGDGGEFVEFTNVGAIPVDMKNFGA